MDVLYVINKDNYVRGLASKGTIFTGSDISFTDSDIGLVQRRPTSSK
jgi:hypothetical protein